MKIIGKPYTKTNRDPRPSYVIVSDHKSHSDSEDFNSNYDDNNYKINKNNNNYEDYDDRNNNFIRH